MVLRQPVISVLGHVDHGKTALLDKIRGTTVMAREAGAITQAIGASYVPIEAIEAVSGSLLQKGGFKINVPGLLFIDTPGHEAFTNLRRRGGSIADFAVLVIDINEGIKPQTKEALEILKIFKTPFLVALNKIDKITGWRPVPSTGISESLARQGKRQQEELDERMYSLIGRLHDLGYRSERYDRVKDFTREIIIVPISAKTGEGIPELLIFIAGVTQRYLEDSLKIEVKGPGKASILEVKETKGAGVTVDAIVYDGIVRKNDSIALSGRRGIIHTKIRALLLPKPMDEMRDPRERFVQVEEVTAAAGVKVVAPNLEDALGGSPLFVAPPGRESEIDDLIRKEVSGIRARNDDVGAIVKADALGTLEAIVEQLKNRSVPVRVADVGDVSKRDAIDAEVVGRKDPLLGVVFAFGVNVAADAREYLEDRQIKLIASRVIFEMFDEYARWKTEWQERELELLRERAVMPCKLHIMPGYVFRQSKPAICGVRIVSGSVRPRRHLVNQEGVRVGRVREIQLESKNIEKATEGMEVAVSMEGVVMGRNVKEGDLLYVDIPEDDAKMIEEKLKKSLTSSEIETFKEFIELRRQKDPFWGL
jgi:translation initiation factor 5B